MDKPSTITASMLGREVKFSTSRSGGPGGQNVNKVNTKVIVKFDVLQSNLLSDEEKRTIQKRLASKLSNEGVLILSSQHKRTQLQNKEAVLYKLETLITKALTKKKARKKTKPSKAAHEKRIERKKKVSEKKRWRQKPM